MNLKQKGDMYFGLGIGISLYAIVRGGTPDTFSGVLLVLAIILFGLSLKHFKLSKDIQFPIE